MDNLSCVKGQGFSRRLPWFKTCSVIASYNVSTKNKKTKLNVNVKMATLKFKEPSPYTVQAHPPPNQDAEYLRHIEDLKLTNEINSQVFGVALFGVGRAGTIHLSYLINLRRVNLLYIVDDDKQKLQKIQNYFNIDTSKTQLITSAEANKVLNDPKVRFLVVASPTYTHEDILKSALNANKAVFCEKPIAGDLEKTKEIYELAKKQNQPLLSAFNRRFDPSYAALRNRVRRGDVGQVLTVKVCSRDSPLPTIDYLTISGGIFHDCAVHDIDQVLYITGELPTKVSCLAHANIPEIKAIDDHDTVAIIMSFDSGAVAMIDLSRHCTYGYEQRVEVFGQKGMLRAENRAPLENIEYYTNEGQHKSPIYYSFASRYAEGYRLELDHFLDVLEGKDKLRVSGANNLAVSKIATAVEKSCREGKIVHLTWSKEEGID